MHLLLGTVCWPVSRQLILGTAPRPVPKQLRLGTVLGPIFKHLYLAQRPGPCPESSCSAPHVHSIQSLGKRKEDDALKRLKVSALELFQIWKQMNTDMKGGMDENKTAGGRACARVCTIWCRQDAGKAPPTRLPCCPTRH